MKKCLLLLCILLLSSNIFADQKGEEIAGKTYELKESADSHSVGMMVLINKKGDQRIRKIEMFSKETNKGTNSLVIFLEPADVKGTKFLTVGHEKGEDEQRLFLPALGKIRRIASSKKGGSFMGSDLNYFDMENHSFQDFTYNYIKKGKFKTMDCDIVEFVPLDENAPYSRQLSWIGSDNHFTYKVECYDKKNPDVLLKTIVIEEVKTLDEVMIATKIVVDNKKTGGKTLFMLTNVQINTGIKNSVFSIQNLEN